METERRRQLLLAALAVVLAIVVYYAWPTASPQSTPSSNQRAAGTSGAVRDRTARGAAPQQTTEVHLEALEAERPKPGPTERNLFRFREKQPPPSQHGAGRGMTEPAVPSVADPPSPPQPAPPPPINLKFLGLVGQAPGKPKIAIFSDGNGPPQFAKEGDVVLGRYRVLKIGEESVEVAYSDGRGRQTIRMTGS
jgi:hypothetical protein